MVKYLLILLLLLISPASNAEPLGIAHNNPGNIAGSVDSGWKGQVPCSDSRTEPDGTYNICFKNWKWGVRAMIVNLHRYQTKHGIDTVQQLTQRWAQKNQDKYADFLAAKLAIDPDTPFGLAGNPVFTTFLVDAMIQWEQGQQPYDFDEIYEVAVFMEWTRE